MLILILGAVYWFGVKPHLPKKDVSSGGQTFAGGSSGNLSSQDAQSGDILVSTSGTKQQWLAREIDKFNQTGQGTAKLASPVESRDAMQDIYNNKLQPTVWSPSSPVWTERLAQLKPGTIDESDPASYRVVFKSPLVFLTTRAKAAQLRPVLTSPAPFTQLARLAAQRKVRFGYADPIAASSGMLTMSLIINEYCRSHGGQDPTTAASSKGFAAFLGQINKGLVKSADNAGSSKLEKAYTSDPNSRDFITAYENAALTAVNANPNLVLIYPNPTANADQGVAVLNTPWVSGAQKTTAQAFLSFLGKADSVNDGMAYNFRPSVGGSAALQAHLSATQKATFQASYTSVELPSYEALNEAAAVYHAIMH